METNTNGGHLRRTVLCYELPQCPHIERPGCTDDFHTEGSEKLRLTAGFSGNGASGKNRNVLFSGTR